MQASIIAFEPVDPMDQRTRELINHMMNWSLGNTQADIDDPEEEDVEIDEVNHDMEMARRLDWFSDEDDDRGIVSPAFGWNYPFIYAHP